MTISPSKNEMSLTESDIQIAVASSVALGKLLGDSLPGESLIRLHKEGDIDSEITLPIPAVRLLFDVLQEMAKGNAVTTLLVENELTTQQAAELLRISRPSLIKMLEEERLPYRKIGAHRRVRYEDVQFYLENERKARKAALKEMIAEQERLGLYE